MDTLARWIIGAFLDSFGKVLVDLVQGIRDQQRDQETGRLQQQTVDAQEAARIQAELADELGRSPTGAEVLERLKRGEA